MIIAFQVMLFLVFFISFLHIDFENEEEKRIDKGFLVRIFASTAFMVSVSL
jgi:hypothetical protein